VRGSQWSLGPFVMPLQRCIIVSEGSSGGSCGLRHFPTQVEYTSIMGLGVEQAAHIWQQLWMYPGLPGSCWEQVCGMT
jgi:hypothetical protein